MQIARRDAGAADIDFTADADRDRLAVLIENVHLRVGDRFADANTGWVGHLAGGGSDGDFRGAVEVPHRFAAVEQGTG